MEENKGEDTTSTGGALRVDALAASSAREAAAAHDVLTGEGASPGTGVFDSHAPQQPRRQQQHEVEQRHFQERLEESPGAQCFLEAEAVPFEQRREAAQAEVSRAQEAQSRASLVLQRQPLTVQKQLAQSLLRPFGGPQEGLQLHKEPREVQRLLMNQQPSARSQQGTGILLQHSWQPEKVQEAVIQTEQHFVGNVPQNLSREVQVIASREQYSQDPASPHQPLPDSGQAGQCLDEQQDCRSGRQANADAVAAPAHAPPCGDRQAFVQSGAQRQCAPHLEQQSLLQPQQVHPLQQVPHQLQHEQRQGARRQLERFARPSPKEHATLSAAHGASGRDGQRKSHDTSKQQRVQRDQEENLQGDRLHQWQTRERLRAPADGGSIVEAHSEASQSPLAIVSGTAAEECTFQSGWSVFGAEAAALRGLCRHGIPSLKREGGSPPVGLAQNAGEVDCGGSHAAGGHAFRGQGYTAQLQHHMSQENGFYGCRACGQDSYHRRSTTGLPADTQSHWAVGSSSSSSSSNTRRRRSCGGDQEKFGIFGQFPRSSMRETAPTRGFNREAAHVTPVSSDVGASRAPASGSEPTQRSDAPRARLQTLSASSEVIDACAPVKSNLLSEAQQEGYTVVCGAGDRNVRLISPSTGSPTLKGCEEAIVCEEPQRTRLQTVSLEQHEDGSFMEMSEGRGKPAGLSLRREARQLRSSSVATSVALSEAAAAVAKRASSACMLPPVGTSLPAALLGDLQQCASASSSAGRLTTELVEQLQVLNLASAAKNAPQDLLLQTEDSKQQQKRTASLSTSNRRATGGPRYHHPNEGNRSRSLKDSSGDNEVNVREWRASADTVSGLRHRPLLQHEITLSRGGAKGTRQHIFLSDSMGRGGDKERRWAGGRVARPLWHEVRPEETPRKLNLTSFVGETWTSRLKGKLIIVVRRLPFDIRTTSNCLAKLECLLLGQGEGVQSPASPSPLSSVKEESNNLSEKGDYEGFSSGAGRASQPRSLQGSASSSAVTSSFLRGKEEGLITPSLSAEDMSRVSAGGPTSHWASKAEANVETDTGRRDAFRLRSLALARELLRRVRSEMQLVPQRGKAIRSLLEAPFGPPSAARSDGSLLQQTEAIPTNPADYVSFAGGNAQKEEDASHPSGLQQQEIVSNPSPGRKIDRAEVESGTSKSSPTSAHRPRIDIGGSAAESREKSVAGSQTPQRVGDSPAGGAATDGLVVLSGADIAWDIATTLKPYVPCITISDLGIDWEDMGLTGSEQQLMQQRVLDTVRRLHPSVHPISLGREARRECYSEQILNTLFHCRTPPVGTGFFHLDWQGYVRMNEEFAKAVQQDYTEGDVVLIYDYHFMLLPLMLRHALPKATIVVHWATVFPSSEMFRILPQRESLLSGLLGADLITFQAYAFHRQFANTCRMLRGAGALAGVRLAIVPRGLDPTPWLQQMRLQKSGGPSDWEELREKLGGRTVFLSVDSISANSGIPHKMVAFRHFLQEHPEYINKVVFVQAAITDSTVYHFVGCINSEFGAVASQAVHFLTVPWTAEGLSPLFACADVCLATSVRESFSWAAYAFILCQKFSNKGVLVLSEFSGSAQVG
ncbi:hypothetical protein ACSSS7_002810 [Eimeria intestinalis]